MRRTTALLSLVLVATTLSGVGTATLTGTGAGAVGAAPRDVSATAVPHDMSAADDGGFALVTSPGPNTTEYLALPRGHLTSSAYVTADLDVAGAVAAQTAEYRGEHRIRSVRRAFYATDDSADRQDIVDTELRNVAARVHDLQEQQRDAIRAYSNDAITTDRFLRELARIHAEAAQQSRIVSVMLNEFQAAPGFSINDRTPFNNVRGELASIQGPVRGQILRAFDGSRSRLPVYVETSAEGVALAQASGDVYRRDTYAGSLRRPDGVDTFRASGNPINAASTRARELYPWLGRVVRSVTALGDTGIYRARLSREHVSSTIYLDGNTSTVFREIQRRTLSGVDLEDPVSATAHGVRLRVNRTHDTGPMLVSIERASNGVPIAGSVTIDGHPVGETGPDGALWVVEPRGAARITASTAAGNVTLRLGQ